LGGKRRKRPPFSWRRCLSLGLGRLRLTPSVFWALSLVEWRATIDARFGAPALGRADFETLMRKFPDGQ
jgi:uncharacterized phage protein (TIGR02216 family)